MELITAKYLREQFDKSLKKLQDECSHDKTEIMPYMWAVGHFSHMVEVCKRCEKIIKELE